MFHYAYVLRSLKDQKLYTGYSNDLRRRLDEHNHGIVRSTQYRRPLVLIYFEGYLNQQDSTAREKFFKTGWGRTYLKRVLKNYLKIKPINLEP